MQQSEVQPINVLSQLIRQWADDRNLIKGSNAKQQFLKLVEEFKETVEGETQAEIMDGLGDAYVVLTIMAAQEGFNIEDFPINPENYLARNLEPIVAFGNLAAKLARSKECYNELVEVCQMLFEEAPFSGVEMNECIQIAYNEIKDRKGCMIDGVFVKQEDLPPEEVYEPLSGNEVFDIAQVVKLQSPYDMGYLNGVFYRDAVDYGFIFIKEGWILPYSTAMRDGWLICKGDR